MKGVLTSVVMKSTVFWHITLHRPLASQPTIRKNISASSSGPKNMPDMKTMLK
jgi:hypothetical protein